MRIPSAIENPTRRFFSRMMGLRNRHFFIVDVLILCVTPAFALVLRTDRVVSIERYMPALVVYTLLALLIRLAVFYEMDMYKRFWRYASVEELQQIITAVLVSSGCIVILFFISRWIVDWNSGLRPYVFLPRSVPLIDTLLVAGAIAASRLSIRMADSWRHVPRSSDTTPRTALIMGAGSAGVMIAREIRRNPQLPFDIVGFVDDDPAKIGIRIQSTPVLGNRKAIPSLVRKYQVDQIIIAMPTASGKDIREIVGICKAAHVTPQIIPGMYELLDSAVDVSQLRNVDIEDLLRREPVRIEIEDVRRLIAGRRVLVTGGGGSIGGELCRQIIRCKPAELIVIGHGENSVFEIMGELNGLGVSDVALHPLIADIRFPDRVNALFKQKRPEIVFHAAAHKHVPLMEYNPAEAVTNNIVGTRNVVAAALTTDVERLVMISTDKAVNPTSIMGVSKRVAELIVHQAAKQSGRAFMAVRFGNVLGSRGSVVLTFRRQIAAGGPVTVTDPEMKRYFMTIPEAVQLVLQAAVLGTGGEAFVLDMGDPVRIVDLARDLIRLSGLEEERDIDIVFTGSRPGEKLFEELFVSGERYERTRHEKVFIAANAGSLVPTNLDLSIQNLELAARNNDSQQIIRQLQYLVPEYTRHPVEEKGTGSIEPVGSELQLHSGTATI
ncbi:MAG: polysaccharide biosynthesis protein [Caldilineaceae bacterium]|nr:polysaccharide biosynthesis protein [Caldilineaceae bacterium]